MCDLHMMTSKRACSGPHSSKAAVANLPQERASKKMDAVPVFIAERGLRGSYRPGGQTKARG